MNYTDLQYEINGFQYRTYLDIEEDNQKIFHYCYKDGKEVTMPREFKNMGPYSYITPDEFRNFMLEAFVQS